MILSSLPLPLPPPPFPTATSRSPSCCPHLQIPFLSQPLLFLLAAIGNSIQRCQQQPQLGLLNTPSAPAKAAAAYRESCQPCRHQICPSAQPLMQPVIGSFCCKCYHPASRNYFTFAVVMFFECVSFVTSPSICPLVTCFSLCAFASVQYKNWKSTSNTSAACVLSLSKSTYSNPASVWFSIALRKNKCLSIAHLFLTLSPIIISSLILPFCSFFVLYFYT